MTIRLALAPLWLQLLAVVAINWAVGTLALVFWREDGGQPREQVGWWIAVAIAGVVLGAVGTAIGRMDGARYRSAVEGVAPQNYGMVARAVVRGPMPTDPTVRTAVIRVASVYLWRAGQMPRFVARMSLWMLCVWPVLAVLQSFATSPNPVLIAMNLPVFVCIAVQQYYVLPLMEARRALLLNVEGVQIDSLNY